MSDSQETIKQMIKMIEQEAKDKADMIREDAKHRSQIERNRIYKEEREKLIREFAKRKEEDANTAKTDRSKQINENRLMVQEGRMKLMHKLQDEVMEALKHELKDKTKYSRLMKDLIVQVVSLLTQGLIRLMEDEVKVRCRAEDISVVKGIASDAAKEYSKFIKQETGTERTVKIEVVEAHPLEKKDTE